MAASLQHNSEQPAPRRRAAARGTRPVSKALEAMLAEPVTVDDAGEPVSRAEQIAARLVELTTDPDPSVSLRAMNMLLERVEGRPSPTDGLVEQSEVQGMFDRAIRMFLNFVPEDRHPEMLEAVDRVLTGQRSRSAPS
ncbi:MAG: hypothetical protein JNM07_07270 [Phycisphaerae bacterium]|nr:hypothetical protein [Phycisphaerae bacterium]